MKLKKFAAVLSALYMMMTTANEDVLNAFISAFEVKNFSTGIMANDSEEFTSM